MWTYSHKISSFLIILCILPVFQCKKNKAVRVEGERESGSTITMRNFKRDAFSDKGQLLWKLRAEEAFIYAKENTSIFYGVDFDQYNEKGKLVSRLKSNRGEINQAKKELRLQGEIELHTDDNSKHLYAEEVIYNTENEQITSDKPVKIVLKGTTIKGRGLEADKGLNKVKVLHPEGITSGN